MAKHHTNVSTSNAPADDRLRRDEASHVRGDRVAEDSARANETGLVDDIGDIEALLDSEFDQVALPTPPQLPGWHLCWLTTGSSYDTVQKRQRLGYIPVVQSDMPNFKTGGMQSAAFEGAITCNEMVLFKIEEARYQAIMRRFHHTRPMEEEEQIYATIEEQTSKADKRGKPLAAVEGEGFDQLEANINRAKRTVPVF